MGSDWRLVRRALDARPPRRAPPAPARAAVALVLRDGPEGLELLFIRRTEHPRDPWSGQMAFPGGRAEPGEDLLATAVRETAEEVGLDLAGRGEALGALDEVEALARMRPMGLTISPFVFRLREGEEARALSEVRSVHWLPLALLLGPSLRSTHEYVHEGAALGFPCLRTGDLVIWGLTYRMFEGLEQRLREAGATAPAVTDGAAVPPALE